MSTSQPSCIAKGTYYDGALPGETLGLEEIGQVVLLVGVDEHEVEWLVAGLHLGESVDSRTLYNFNNLA